MLTVMCQSFIAIFPSSSILFALGCWTLNLSLKKINPRDSHSIPPQSLIKLSKRQIYTFIINQLVYQINVLTTYLLFKFLFYDYNDAQILNICQMVTFGGLNKSASSTPHSIHMFSMQVISLTFLQS